MQNFFKKILFSLLLFTATVPLNALIVRLIIVKNPKTGQLVLLVANKANAGTKNERKIQIDTFTKNIKELSKDGSQTFEILLETTDEETAKCLEEFSNLSKSLTDEATQQHDTLVKNFSKMIINKLPGGVQSEVIASPEKQADIKQFVSINLMGTVRQTSHENTFSLDNNLEISLFENLSKLENISLHKIYSYKTKDIFDAKISMMLCDYCLWKALDLENIDLLMEQFHQTVKANAIYTSGMDLSYKIIFEEKQRYLNHILKQISSRTQNSVVRNLAKKIGASAEIYFKLRQEKLINAGIFETPFNQLAVNLSLGAMETGRAMIQQKKAQLPPLWVQIQNIWETHLVTNLEKYNKNKYISNQKVAVAIESQLDNIGNFTRDVIFSLTDIQILDKIDHINQSENINKIIIVTNPISIENLRKHLHQCGFTKIIYDSKLCTKDGKTYECRGNLVDNFAKKIQVNNMRHGMVLNQAAIMELIGKNIAPLKLCDFDLIQKDLTNIDTNIEFILKEIASRVNVTRDQLLGMLHTINPAPYQPQPKPDPEVEEEGE